MSAQSFRLQLFWGVRLSLHLDPTPFKVILISPAAAAENSGEQQQHGSDS